MATKAISAGISAKLSLIGWGLAILTAALTVILAALQTGRYVDSDQYALLMLTTLTPQTAYRGFVTAALHRMRILIALSVALMPAAVGGTVNGAIFAHTYWIMMRFGGYYYYRYKYESGETTQPSAVRRLKLFTGSRRSRPRA